MTNIVKLACSSSITFHDAGGVEKSFLQKKVLETELQFEMWETMCYQAYFGLSFLFTAESTTFAQGSITPVGK